MVINYNIVIAKKFVSVFTVFSLISILILTANTVSACHYTLDTFESDYSTKKDDFFKGETVYGRGNAYGYNYFLKLRIVDPDGNIVYYSGEAKNEVKGSFFLNESSKIGEWEIQLGINKSGWQWPSGQSSRTAYFNVKDANFTLTININGNGSVDKDPNKSGYDYNETVDLTAVPDLGWSFYNWTGDLESEDNSESIVMDCNKTVTANFVQNQYVLNVSVVGNGSVTIDPDLSYYVYGDIVNLTALPNTSWNFDHWEEDLSGNDNPASITIDDDKNVTALFLEEELEPEPLYNLTVNVTGNGLVTKDPDQENYSYGTEINLTAVPDSGWSFSHWSDNLSGSINPVKINMTEDKYVTAHFAKQETSGNGGGGSRSFGEKINYPPVADLSSGEIYHGLIDEEIEFNGAFSFDKDGHIVEWLWDFGDGTSAVGEIITHAYSDQGNYTVLLTVTDNNGANGTDETTAVVIQPNRPPSKPNVTGPTEGLVNIEYNFSIVSTDEDNDDIKYNIDWGGGTTDESVFLPSGKLYNVSHKWTEPGEYLINVLADDGDTISQIKVTISIEDPKIPEESNIILILLMLLAFLFLLLFWLIGKQKKNEGNEEGTKGNKKSK